MQGRKYLTAEVAQMLAESLAQPTPEVPHAALSERELQTLVKIASGRACRTLPKN
jgi:two-component system invasion response regulator UvrY